MELLPWLHGSAELKWANHIASQPFPRLPMEREGHLFKGSEGLFWSELLPAAAGPQFHSFPLANSTQHGDKETTQPPSWEAMTPAGGAPQQCACGPRPDTPPSARPHHSPASWPGSAHAQRRKWRLRPSRCGLSATCPACCFSCPSATFCREMVSSRLGAAPGELVARGSPEPQEAGDRRLGAAARGRSTALQPAPKTGVP